MLLSSALMVALFVPAAPAQTPSRFEGRLVQEGTGAPVAGASVSIVGMSGSARTDNDGRFTWAPAPQVPFQVIVVLSGGQVARPVVVDALQEGTTSIQLRALTDEAVTVLGAAPSINAAPGSATTVLSGTQIARRNPENLMQALETVPGINQVSEGHAAVPAVRGLARGRTLFLIDGGRVTAERRVGPSGTFLDPSVVEGIDIARGPGSVAYGSDALGGVISVRTRRAEPGSPLRARVTGTIGAGVPEGRGSFEVSKGLERGGVLVQAHVRNAEDYDSPEGEVFNSGWEDQGFLVHFTHAVGEGFLSAAWQSDYGRDFERPRNNSRTVRFFYPFENSHRFTASYQIPDVAGFDRWRSPASWAPTSSGRTRTAFPRLPPAAASSARTSRRTTSMSRGARSGCLARRGSSSAPTSMAATGSRRSTSSRATTLPAMTRDTTNVSVDDARGSIRACTSRPSRPSAVGARLGRLRGDRVTTRNVGGFFGDRSTSNAAASGFGAITVGPFQGFSVTAQVSRGFRDPVLSDRYFRGPSGRGFITGNPDLEPERVCSSTFRPATRRRGRRSASTSTSTGSTTSSSDIKRRPISSSSATGAGPPARLRGRGTLGAGMGYSVELGRRLRAARVDDNADLDDISPATSPCSAGRSLARGYALTRLAFYADDDRPGPTEIAAPGSSLVDVGGGWRLQPQLELRGLLRNLFDDDYYASPDARLVLAPGRSVSLTAVVQF